MTNYEFKKVVRCLKKIFNCAIIDGNVYIFIFFILVIPLFIFGHYIEIQNIGNLVMVFEGEKSTSMKDYCFKTLLELLVKLLATAISDLACVYFFYTGLETTLLEFLSLDWNRFHKFSLGNLLTMQYEKAQSMPKLIYELMIVVIVCIFKIFFLIKKITMKTNKIVGIAFSTCTIVHVLLFFMFFKTYNILQSKFLHSKSKSRSIIASESKNFNVIKTYNMENASIKKVNEGQEKRRVSKMKYAIFDARSALVYKFFEIFSISFLYGFYYLDIFESTFLNSLIKEVVSLYETMRDLLKSLNELRNEFHVYYTLEEYIENNHKKNNNSSCQSIQTLEKLSLDMDSFIDLKCVNLSSPQGIFKNISFSVMKNEKIAVAGCNNSGKTTLLRMIVGLYDFDGEITINSININSIDPYDLHNIVTFISQNDAYTYGSIMKNLQYGNSLSREEIIARCKLFDIDSMFESLENGYDKCSDTLGTEFSGGQKQRISFMRGMLRETPLVVIDDCLNGVSTNDKHFLIQKVLSLQEKTVIMTCNNFENLKAFDKILLLNSEESKFGTFQELKDDLKIHFNHA